MTSTTRRLLAGMTGAILLAWTARLLYSMLVRNPQYRTGTFADYHIVLTVCLALYGGTAIGLLTQARRVRAGTLTAFRAGFIGAAVTTGLLLIVAMLRQGAGNLWGLVVILGALGGALVAAGAALLWYAAYGPPRHV